MTGEVVKLAGDDEHKSAKAGPSRGLGRGLSALLGDAEPLVAPAAAAKAPRATNRLPVAFLSPNPYQPRHAFAADALDDLTRSIREKGVLQPILVRPAGPDSYQIVAGERRWRAAQAAGLHDVPVIVRELSDIEALELALVENIQRKDLTPTEEAEGYARLGEEFGYTQEDIARIVGKSRSHITNLLRLLTLPATVQAMIADGALSMGHARALVGAEDAVALARKIVSDTLSVRQAEALAAVKKGAASRKTTRAARPKDANTRALERNVSVALGLRVAIDHKGERGGTVKISYKTLEQLEDLCQKLAQE